MAGPGPRSPVLEIHLEDLAVALEEALHVALPGLVAEAADVDPRHRGAGAAPGGRQGPGGRAAA